MTSGVRPSFVEQRHPRSAGPREKRRRSPPRRIEGATAPATAEALRREPLAGTSRPYCSEGVNETETPRPRAHTATCGRSEQCAASRRDPIFGLRPVVAGLCRCGQPTGGPRAVRRVACSSLLPVVYALPVVAADAHRRARSTVGAPSRRPTCWPAGERLGGPLPSVTGAFISQTVMLGGSCSGLTCRLPRRQLVVETGRRPTSSPDAERPRRRRGRVVVPLADVSSHLRYALPPGATSDPGGPNGQRRELDVDDDGPPRPSRAAAGATGRALP